MNKKLRKKFILACLTGGILFAILFYVAFGAGYGYTQELALICLLGGLFFSVAFYVIWMIVGKFQKPISFENPKAQQKLLDYEAIRNAQYECKFSAHMSYGSGLKYAICEAILYFESDMIRIDFYYFRKIYSFEIPYELITEAIIEDEKILLINVSEVGDIVFSIKNYAPQLEAILIEKVAPKDDVGE